MNNIRWKFVVAVQEAIERLPECKTFEVSIGRVVMCMDQEPPCERVMIHLFTLAGPAFMSHVTPELYQKQDELPTIAEHMVKRCLESTKDGARKDKPECL
jgi:hypothetical protein